MYKIIGDMEGDASFQGGRRSISPIPKRPSVYDNPPEREPVRANRYVFNFFSDLKTFFRNVSKFFILYNTSPQFDQRGSYTKLLHRS